MSVDQLPVFRQQFSKSMLQVTVRMYKAKYAILSLYPGFCLFEKASLFDKAYLLQQVEVAFSHQAVGELSIWEAMAVPTLMDFEKEAEKLLQDGGTRNLASKDLAVIQRIQEVIAQ